MDDEFFKPVKKTTLHELGADLALLSVSELEERILQLKSEITRLEQSIKDKSASKQIADSFFKK